MSKPQQDAVSSALRTITTEADGLAALAQAMNGTLGQRFAEAVEIILQLSGRVITTGMGKSGHVAQKTAATLASTGTPAYYVHPGEAGHGDLGMITKDDAIIALSWSGETTELHPILGFAKRFAVPLIAITSKTDSTLAKAADYPLVLPRTAEACPHGLAPTTSTIVQLALADSLAIALLEMRGFSADDFGVFHPGGQLGAYLKHLGDVMHVGTAMPLAATQTPVSTAIDIMTEKSLGCIGLTDESGRLVGMITDGDVRRHAGTDLLDLRALDIMTRDPKTVGKDAFLGSVVQTLSEMKITAIFVVDDTDKPIGLVHLHDLLRAGLA